MSWNIVSLKSKRQISGQPLREAVSWNTWILVINSISFVSLFVRLWVEISISLSNSSFLFVSLFVRLWVEISQDTTKTSFWTVSLFVRLWVEMYNFIESYKKVEMSASSWGCELKYRWNDHISILFPSASSWGCELKYQPNKSWEYILTVSLFVRLWVEILTIMRMLQQRTVSLFVRLWVEISRSTTEETKPRSASSWGCELKCQSYQLLHQKKESASSWGCELKWYMLHEAYSSK